MTMNVGSNEWAVIVEDTGKEWTVTIPDNRALQMSNWGEGQSLDGYEGAQRKFPKKEYPDEKSVKTAVRTELTNNADKLKPVASPNPERPPLVQTLRPLGRYSPTYTAED
jgi:hypothetical protein